MKLRRCKHKECLYFLETIYGFTQVAAGQGTIKVCRHCKKWMYLGVFGLWRKLKLWVW